MSEENVEIVRRLYDAVNRGGVEAVLEFAAPDVEAVPPSNWPESPIRRGFESVQDLAREWVEAFDDFKVEPERFLDAAGDRVVVYVRDRGRIRGSATEIDTRLIHIWTLTGGKVTRWEVFTDESQALEAAGLRE